MRNAITALSLLTLAACGGRGEDTSSTETGMTGTTETGMTETGMTDTSATGVDAGFAISGNAVNLENLEPLMAEDACVAIADPTAAIGGGELDILAVAGVDAADGSFLVEGIVTSSSVGLFMIVGDCDMSNTVLQATATGVASESYSGLGDGDVIEGATALSISMTLSAGIDMSVAAVGRTETIADDGAMAGFVLDSMGTPVTGALVCGSDCADTLYFDTNEMDGLFTTGGQKNGATDASAMGGFFVPGASVYTYTVEHDDYDWDSLLFGAVPGVVSFVQFVAN